MTGQRPLQRGVWRLAAALFLMGLIRPVCAQEVVADLSDHLIAVTTGFSGTKLLLFGAIDGEAADVIVVVREIRALPKSSFEISR